MRNGLLPSAPPRLPIPGFPEAPHARALTPRAFLLRVLLPHLPPWMMPDDVAAVRLFYTGLPAGAAVPWQPWLRPLLAWSVLVAALYLVMISLSVLIAEQWIRRERLSFPLMFIPLEV